MFEIWRVEIWEKAALQVAVQTPSSQLPMSSKCAQYQLFFAFKNITKPKIFAIHPHNFSHLFFISVSEVACPWTSSYILSHEPEEDTELLIGPFFAFMTQLI